MKFILLILSLLLLLYRFETTEFFNKSINEKLILWWTLRNQKIILHILPHDEYILVNREDIYLYLDKNNIETYVPAIKLRENAKQFIINYRYLLEWSDEPPKMYHYPDHLSNIIDIVNHAGTL